MDFSKFNCRVDTVEKNQLFYNQYQYSIKFYQTEIGVLRGLDPNKIDNTVAHRNLYRSQIRFGKRYPEIPLETVNELKLLCDVLHQYQDQLKFVASFNVGYVYTNNTEIFQKILDLGFVSINAIQQAQVSVPADTIFLRNPKWAHRTYFRSRTLTEHQRDLLIQYLDSRKNIKLSPGLKTWCTEPTNRWWDKYTHDYFFVDHNDPGEILFLNMVVPRITRRTFRLVAK